MSTPIKLHERGTASLYIIASCVIESEIKFWEHSVLFKTPSNDPGDSNREGIGSIQVKFSGPIRS